jgi:Tol biopolymer transport system component
MHGRTLMPLLVAGLLVSLCAVPAARAAFPGLDGRIAFQREAPAGDHTQTDIYTVNPDGADLERLTASPDRNELGPAWNATGTQIAFWRTKAPFGAGSLWVMDADGTNQRRLTSGFDARDPAWNPAGTRLAYTRVGPTGNFDIWALRVSDGRGRKRITHGPAFDFEPAWSPDRTRIAFSRGFEKGDAGDPFLIDLGTDEVTRITHSRAYDHQVAWAPDGRGIVFERDFPRSSTILTADADGSSLERLTRGGFFDTGPAFSPRGGRIVFGTDRGGEFLPDLWLMRADGSHLHRLLHMRFAESFPDWQPIPG